MSPSQTDLSLGLGRLFGNTRPGADDGSLFGAGSSPSPPTTTTSGQGTTSKGQSNWPRGQDAGHAFAEKEKIIAHGLGHSSLDEFQFVFGQLLRLLGLGQNEGDQPLRVTEGFMQQTQGRQDIKRI